MQALTTEQGQLNAIGRDWNCGPYDASTMSLPPGDIDAEPTGLSSRKEASSSKVGLS